MENECTDIVELAEGPSVCISEEQSVQRGVQAHEKVAYCMKVILDKPFSGVIDAVKSSLVDQGLSIVNEIDIRQLMESKLGIYFPHYTILGVCNPRWAQQALEMDRDVGLLLPCNMVVYEQSGSTVAAAIDPVVQLSIISNPDMLDLARVVKDKLQSVLDKIAA
ncbi:MAG: DUF302 domain-containing protein [Armatimonadota bacterium]